MLQYFFKSEHGSLRALARISAPHSDLATRNVVLEDELGSARRAVLILKSATGPALGTDFISVAAHREAVRRKEEELTNDMTVQLSRGHVEILRDSRETMESLNGEVQWLNNDKERLEKERDHFHESSTKGMNAINYLRN